MPLGVGHRGYGRPKLSQEWPPALDEPRDVVAFACKHPQCFAGDYIKGTNLRRVLPEVVDELVLDRGLYG